MTEFNEMKNEVLLLHKKLDEINIKLDKILNDTYNMNTHISFIEKVYDTIKNPFYFILNKIDNNCKIAPEKQLQN